MRGIRKRRGGFTAQITRGGLYIHGGTYATIEEAMAALAELEKKHPKAMYRKPPIDTGIPGEPRTVNVPLPYDLWVALDRKARKENKSRASIVQPFVVAAIQRELSNNGG